MKEAVGEFTKTLMEAIGIVLAVSFLSLGWRPGIVVAIAIPLVLAIMFVVMEYCRHLACSASRSARSSLRSACWSTTR